MSKETAREAILRRHNASVATEQRIGFAYERDPALGVGHLPYDAVLRLKRAAGVGQPGSMDRRVAINRAYRYIDQNYPQYLKRGASR